MLDIVMCVNVDFWLSLLKLFETLATVAVCFEHCCHHHYHSIRIKILLWILVSMLNSFVSSCM